MKKDALYNVALEVLSNCKSQTPIHKKYKQAVDYYAKGIDRATFDYLRKVGKGNNYILPAKARNMDRLSPRLRYLAAREARREILYSLNFVDQSSLDEKNDIQVKLFVENLEKIAREKLSDLDVEISATNDFIAKIGEQLALGKQNISVLRQRQENGENITEEQIMSANEALQEMERQVKETNIRVEHRLKYIYNKKIVDTEQLNEIARISKMSAKDIREEKVQELMEAMIFNMNLDEQKKYAFFQALIVGIGAEYYYVDYEENSIYPIFEALHPSDVFYPQTSNTWVQDGDWVGFRKYMSTEQILRQFSPSDSVIARLKSRDTFYSASMYQNYNGGAKFNESGSGNSTFHEVYFLFWTKEVNVVFSEFENKHNPKNPHIHLTEDSTLPPKKNEKRETRYMTDIYTAVIVDDEFILEPQVKTEVVRSVDNYSIPKLPVVGLVFDDRTRKPYSLVMETKDAVELSIVVNFKLELIIALSGVKGFIMDDTQRPSNMSRDEWNYLKKMGTAWIESQKKGQRPSSFNQFQTYDDTLPPSVETLIQIDESLEKHFDLATGVTRQSLAQIEQYDLKGNTQMAQNQTMMITEIYYETHERIYCKALEQLINLKARYYNENEIVAAYNHPDFGYKSVKIPAKMLMEKDISIVVQDSGRDERLVQTLQSVAMKYFQEKAIPFKVLSSILTSNSFKKIESKISHFIDEFEQMQLQNASSVEEKKAMIEERKINAKGEIDKMLKQMELQIEDVQSRLDAERLAFDREKFAFEKSIKEKELVTDSSLKKYEIDSERAVETAYLGEQKRQSLVDENIQRIELMLQTLLTTLSEKNYRDIEFKKSEQKQIKSKEKIKD